MSTAPQVEQLPSGAGNARPSLEDWAQTLLIKTWNALKGITHRVKVQQARKSLRVCESVSLGEKRFVAVVQVDEERFLIGGSSGSVSLLSRLHEAQTFAAVLEKTS
jgi:flagellar biogenesis protein FliO